MYDIKIKRRSGNPTYTLPAAILTDVVNKDVTHKGILNVADNSQNAVLLDTGRANDVYTISGKIPRVATSINWNGSQHIIPGILELQDAISNWWVDGFIYLIETPEVSYTGIFGNCSIAMTAGDSETAEFNITFYVRTRNESNVHVILQYEQPPPVVTTSDPDAFQVFGTDASIISMQFVDDLNEHMKTAEIIINDDNNEITIRDENDNPITTRQFVVGQRVRLVDATSRDLQTGLYTRILLNGTIHELASTLTMGGSAIKIDIRDHMAELLDVSIDDTITGSSALNAATGQNLLSYVQAVVARYRINGAFNPVSGRKISIGVQDLNNLSQTAHNNLNMNFIGTQWPVKDVLHRIAESDEWIGGWTDGRTAAFQYDTQGSNFYLDEQGQFIWRRVFGGYPTDPLNNGLTLVYGENIDDNTLAGNYKIGILPNSLIPQTQRGQAGNIIVHGRGGNPAISGSATSTSIIDGRKTKVLHEHWITNNADANRRASVELSKTNHSTIWADLKIAGYPKYRYNIVGPILGDNFKLLHTGDMVYLRIPNYEFSGVFQVVRITYNIPSMQTEIRIVKPGSGTIPIYGIDMQFLDMSRKIRALNYSSRGPSQGVDVGGINPPGSIPPSYVIPIEYQRFSNAYVALGNPTPTAAQINNNLFFYPLSNALLELVPSDRLRTFDLQRLALFSNNFLVNNLSDIIPLFPNERLNGTAYVVDASGSLGFGPQTVSGSGFSLDLLNNILPDSTTTEQDRREGLGLPRTRTSSGVPTESGTIITPNGADNPPPGLFTLLRPIGTQYPISWRFGEIDAAFSAATGYDGHNGIDFLVSFDGTNDGVVPVYSPIAGTISFMDAGGASSAGIYVEITQSIGSSSITVRLLHLNRINDGIAIGTTVSRGQEIGRAGSTGYVDPAAAVISHMDLTYPNANPDNIPNFGSRVDPEPFLVNS